jgi:hypothetical protein
MTADTFEAGNARLATTINANLFRAAVLIVFVVAAWAMLMSLGEVKSTALAGFSRMLAL